MTPGLVSLCIPTLGRATSLARCLNAIDANTDWPFEVIVEHDEFGPGRRGCPKTLALAVERAQGEFIAFIGNDCSPRPGWLRAAMRCMHDNFPDWTGLVGTNDLGWKDGRCLHFVINRALIPMIGGEIFHTGYNHVACDDELQARAAQIGKYVWCQEAVVAHNHFTCGAEFDEVYQAAWKAESVERDRALLRERAQQFGFGPWLR